MRNLALAGLLALASCASYEEQCANTYGFQPGTVEYFSCVRAMEQEHQTRLLGAASMINQGGTMMGAGPQPVRPRMACTSFGQGVFTQTQCQ